VDVFTTLAIFAALIEAIYIGYEKYRTAGPTARKLSSESMENIVESAALLVADYRTQITELKTQLQQLVDQNRTLQGQLGEAYMTITKLQRKVLDLETRMNKVENGS